MIANPDPTEAFDACDLLAIAGTAEQRRAVEALAARHLNGWRRPDLLK